MGNTVVILYEHRGNTMGRVWEHSGNTREVLWEHTGNTLRIPWQCYRNSMGIPLELECYGCAAVNKVSSLKRASRSHAKTGCMLDLSDLVQKSMKK